MKKLADLDIRPAPWSAEVNEDEQLIVYDAEEHDIGQCFGSVSESCIMKSAPKLYEAVYDLLEIVGNVSEYISVDCGAMNKVEKARAALAEAAGESEVSNG